MRFWSPRARSYIFAKPVDLSIFFAFDGKFVNVVFSPAPGLSTVNGLHPPTFVRRMRQSLLKVRTVELLVWGFATQ